MKKSGLGVKKAMAPIMAVIVVLNALTGCSGESPIDPEAVEVSLGSQPESIAAGSPVELQAAVDGMALSDAAEVTFDIRTAEGVELVEAVRSGDVFSGTYTFQETGIQAVFVHVYEGDLHITKKKWVEVK